MAIIPEAIISRVVEELIALPADELKQRVKLVVGVKDQVWKLTENFKTIQAVVADAERKQIKDSSMKLWLDELKEISYDMDDVVDEWRSEMMRRSHNLSPLARTTKKVCPFITFFCFRFCEIGLRHDIALKIKELNGKLDEIAERRNKFNLVPHVGVGNGDKALRRNTVSVINKMKVKGRAEEEEQIINMLLSLSSDEVPQIISIVGMGGLGKTTLAQLAYNDARVEKHFDKRIWVCVSDPFDEIKIANAILESPGGVSGTVLQTMVQDIRSKIGEKRYLLVLDDVWNEDGRKWNNLGTVLECGLPGSTILVTTRSDTVARIMGCKKSKTFRPGVLSDEECWSIICHDVELFGKTKEDLEQLEDIGKEIAKKCKGLPLAAKALGGLLSSKDSRKEWQSVLDSEMWQLGEEETKIGSQLFAPLYLSYLDLSPVEKLCLSHCVLFPKDYDIRKGTLVKMWMAQGYLKETNTKDMEMVAEESFRNLSSRSFFQDFQENIIGKTERFKMHDIVHDFIQFIANKECLSSEQLNDESINDLDKCPRHLFFHPSSMDKFGNSIFSFKKLRSLYVSDCKKLDLCRLFNELTCLRSLVLFRCDIREIPSEIGRLIHLRLLDISENFQLRVLPETIGKLCNLIIFDTSGCGNLRFPGGIEKLSNLRYFICEGVDLTQKMGRLNALREAKFFVRSEACSLGNLNNLNHLSSVDIHVGRQVEHVIGAKQADLNKKKDLIKLLIAFGEEDEQVDILEQGDEVTNRWKVHDEEVIEALQPCSNLEDLEITGYLGANPNPIWLMSLQHLRILKLSNWKSCNNLPALGKLRSLTALWLDGFEKVKNVGVDFFGIDETLSSDWAFPKLEWLSFENFSTWEEWEMKDLGNFSIMPFLAALIVENCPKLQALPDNLLQKTTIEVLDINSSPLLEEWCKSQKGVHWPQNSHIRHLYM